MEQERRAGDLRLLEQQRLRAIIELGEEAYALYREGKLPSDRAQTLAAKIRGADMQLMRLREPGGIDLSRCPQCGKEVGPHNLYCSCGFHMKEYRDSFDQSCPDCGEKAQRSQKYCTVCGHRLK